MSDRAEIQQRLDEIEESLAYLRGELGPSSSGETGDYGDEALSLEERDEQASQIELLEAERDRLKARLGKA